MSHTTRRRFLAASGAALLADLAGCNRTPDNTETETPDAVPDPTSVSDPERVRLRTTGGPAAWLPATNATSATSNVTTNATGESGATSTDTTRLAVVTSDSAAERVRFATDASGVDDARSFVETMDYDAATLCIDTHRVRACDSLRLCALRWTGTGVRASYHLERDTTCDDVRRSWVTLLLRLPVALDDADVRRVGTAVRTAGCPTDAKGTRSTRPGRPTRSGHGDRESS
ncbi:hypothetical protein MBEHAL_2185 [Halarchaeum acidiphilum MH1-52-1]|uniref:Uncharacterized protein n=1 Tax=Halarchaeum acidiphilum MH1-52-1 TaxID=1261545 RepID=U2YWL8_9EURY|nr:hypothetical protein [Halarchaeum acidiphilum]GAD53425.1 hypothetical protein MBEHAL_2185 [Halarchaeum acidiphilum MH1-52-1]